MFHVMIKKKKSLKSMNRAIIQWLMTVHFMICWECPIDIMKREKSKVKAKSPCHDIELRHHEEVPHLVNPEAIDGVI